MHTLASQLAVGVLAFGIRHLIRRRREAKHKAAEAAAQAPSTTSRGMSTSQGQGAGTPIDPELSTALDTVTRELQGATDSIRRLAYTVPPSSHRDCAVRDALVADAERLSGSLANMQASINNMRNLHPGLEARAEKRRRDRARGGEREKDRARGTERARERERDREEGRERARERQAQDVRTSRREGRAEEVREKGNGEEWVERVRSSRRGQAEDLGTSGRDRRHRVHRRADDGLSERSTERLRRRLGRRDEELQRGRRPAPVER
jgi:hypothetical protein